MNIIIIGAGGHGQVIADTVLLRRAAGENIDIVGFLDDDISLKGKNILGIPVLGNIEYHTSVNFDRIVIGIGVNKIRTMIFRKFASLGRQFYTAIHPASVIAPNVSIGEGTVIFAGTVVNTGSVIGENSIINTAATVDHHGDIGSHAHIGPGVHLGGTVKIGEGAFIGIGSTILPNISVGSWSIIGAGATVINNIPTNVTAIGTPAKIIKNNADPIQ